MTSAVPPSIGVWGRSPWSRAFLGTCLGALFTLCLHPRSRPFLLNMIDNVSAAQVEACVDTHAITLETPKNLMDASLWVQIAAQKLGTREGLRPQERKETFAVVREAVRSEPSNAYWPQILAILLTESGNGVEARKTWLAASRCSKWTDYQTERLLAARKRIVAETGLNQSWQLAYLYSQRSDTACADIERYARQILTHADLDSRNGLETRLATIINGQLLRNGSRWIKAGQHGANIIELAAYPADMTRTNNPKRLLLGQNRVINSLRALGRNDDAGEAQVMFRNNEAWKALTESENSEEAARFLTTVSLFSATAAGSLLIASMAGGILWGLGRLADLFTSRTTSFGLFPATAVGFVFGVCVYYLTRVPWAAAAAALSFAFLSIGPRNVRSAPSSDLGPLFTFVILTIGTFFSLSLALFASGQAAAAKILSPILGLPLDFYGSHSRFAGLSVIILGLVFLVAPMYALVQRRTTPAVLSVALRRLGAIVGVGGLLITFVAVPAVAAVDQSLETTFQQLVENEPVHYLIR